MIELFVPSAFSASSKQLLYSQSLWKKVVPCHISINTKGPTCMFPIVPGEFYTKVVDKNADDESNARLLNVSVKARRKGEQCMDVLSNGML